MFRSSAVLVAGLLASLAACADSITAPKGNHESYGGSGVVIALTELEGVVELADDGRFALRQMDRAVPLIDPDESRLYEALGREVVVRGRFLPSGEFSIATLSYEKNDPKDGEATLRLP
jgi:hypothetical protein